jgi:hypothetical protein
VSEKPNFCAKCGTSFAHASLDALDELPEEYSSEEAVDGLENILNLRGLDVEIDTINRQGDTVANLAGTAKAGDHPKGGGLTKDDERESYTEEDFKREAGSSRQKSGGNEKEET